MGADDIKHTAKDLLGKGKEAIGEATGNDKLAAEGKADQVEAKAGRAASDAKDAAGDAAKKLTGDR
jgi:uncharacterized protein YjbJ (UPF0337 family)